MRAGVRAQVDPTPAFLCCLCVQVSRHEASFAAVQANQPVVVKDVGDGWGVALAIDLESSGVLPMCNVSIGGSGAVEVGRMQQRVPSRTAPTLAAQVEQLLPAAASGRPVDGLVAVGHQEPQQPQQRLSGAPYACPASKDLHKVTICVLQMRRACLSSPAELARA